MNRKGITLLAWLLILLIAVPSSVALLKVISHIPDRDIQRGREIKMGLVYQDTKQVSSESDTWVTSAIPTDDPHAELIFTLEESRVVLVLYQIMDNNELTYEGYDRSGARCLINIDGVDQIDMRESHHYPDLPTSGSRGGGACIFWIGNLGAGPHTIKGRVACNNGNILVNFRRLTALIFKGSAGDFQFVRSTAQVSRSSVTFGDDAPAVINLNLSQPMKALILYEVCNYRGTAHHSEYGRCINVAMDGTDLYGGYPYGIMYNAYAVQNEAEYELFVHLTTLSAGVHTIQGRFRCDNSAFGAPVAIDERAIAVLLFDAGLETDFVWSAGIQSLSGTGRVNDAYAEVNRTLLGTRYLLAIYNPIRHYTYGSGYWGHQTYISVDGIEYGRNAQCSSDGINQRAGNALHNVLGVGAGSHIVRGRLAVAIFAPPPEASAVTRRQLACLWFPPSPEEPPPTPPPEAYETKTKGNPTPEPSTHMVSEGLPALTRTRVRWVHRTTKLVPWVV